jgi:mono/diheme cytochrome c family protein
MRKPRWSYRLLIVLVILGLSLAACGGKEKKKATPVPSPAPTEAVEATPVPSAIPTESVEGPAEGTEPPGMLTGVAGDPVKGKALFASAGCTTCHNVDTDEALTGPSLKGLGSEAAEGQIDGVPALEFLHQSIVDPGAALADDFPNVMPSFKDTLTEEQIQDLIAYLVTLTS